MSDYFLGKCSLIVGDDQFSGISTHFWGVILGSTDRVFGILLQIHQIFFGRGQTLPPLFGNGNGWDCMVSGWGEVQNTLRCLKLENPIERNF